MEGIGEGYKRIGKKWRSRREWGEDLVLAVLGSALSFTMSWRTREGVKGKELKNNRGHGKVIGRKKREERQEEEKRKRSDRKEGKVG